MKIRLAGIVPNSNSNGPGLRDVIFSQGCSHHCPYCFNKHTWDFNLGKICDCDKIIKQCIDRTYLSGITFSGGDPFDQPEPFAYIAKQLKKHHINIWCYTGYTFEQLITLSKNNKNIRQLLNNIDILVDGPFINSKKSTDIQFRGSTNQRIINIKQSLKNKKVIIDIKYI